MGAPTGPHRADEGNLPVKSRERKQCLGTLESSRQE